MAMIIEPVQDSADLIMYSVQKRTAVAYKVTKVLPSTSPMFSYRNTVGYEATYTSEKVPHSIYVAHMIFRNIGIEIICDSTTELIPKVKTDFQSFLQSITFNEDEE